MIYEIRYDLSIYWIEVLSMRSLAALDDRPNGSAAPDRSRGRGAHLVDPSIDALPGGPAARTRCAQPRSRLEDERLLKAPAPGGRRPRGALPQADPGPRAETTKRRPL